MVAIRIDKTQILMIRNIDELLWVVFIRSNMLSFLCGFYVRERERERTETLIM